MKKLLLVLILFFIIVCYSFSQDNWVSPTGHYDPDNEWYYEERAYDDNTSSFAYDDLQPYSWGSFLELNHSAISCDKVRFKAPYSSPGQSSINLDIYYGAAWHDVYDGAYLNYGLVEKTLGGTYTITKARVNFYNSGGTIRTSKLYDFVFNDVTEGWSHKWNTKEISKWNTKEFTKWNDLE